MKAEKVNRCNRGSLLKDLIDVLDLKEIDVQLPWNTSADASLRLLGELAALLIQLGDNLSA